MKKSPNAPTRSGRTVAIPPAPLMTTGSKPSGSSTPVHRSLNPILRLRSMSLPTH